MTAQLPLFFEDAGAPLHPDPFSLEDSRPVNWESTPFFCPQRILWSHPVSARDLFRPIECSLALIAFIPPAALPVPYNVFSDDGVVSQDSWLSKAYLTNRYRMIHGLRLVAFVDHRRGFSAHLPDGRVLGKANPTRFRGVSAVQFRAPLQISHYPTAGRLPPPPYNHGQEMVAAGSDMRAMNGFLANPLGRVTQAVFTKLTKLSRKKPRPEFPQIGVSIQIWLAQDGCKCFAFAHNYFPKYSAYLDGVLLDWDSARDFDKFDGYEIEVEWQPFVAFLLYDALRSYPLRARYPGACGIGWYREVNESGKISWCDKGPQAHFIKFKDKEKVSETQRVAWWQALERYTSRFTDLHETHRDSQPSVWWADDPALREAWKQLDITSCRVSKRNT